MVVREFSEGDGTIPAVSPWRRCRAQIGGWSADELIDRPRNAAVVTTIISGWSDRPITGRDADGLFLHYAVQSKQLWSVLRVLARYVDGFDTLPRRGSRNSRRRGRGCRTDSRAASALGHESAIGAGVTRTRKRSRRRARLDIGPARTQPKSRLASTPVGIRARAENGGIASPFRGIRIARLRGPAIHRRGASGAGSTSSPIPGLAADACRIQRATVALAAAIDNAVAASPTRSFGRGFGSLIGRDSR